MHDEPIDLHQLRAHEHDAVRALILAGLVEHWGTIDTTLNADLDDLAHDRADRLTVVASADGTVVGTGTIVRRDATTSEIVRISVAASHRQHGLGRRLVEELAAIARRWGCERIVLETTAAWTQVVEFYMRCGFALTHFHDGDFGRDAWFERRLGDDGYHDRHALG